MNPTKLPFPRDLLPDIPGLVLEDTHYVDHEMIVVLKSTAPAVVCPLCRTPSTRIHSRYRRAPTDLPWGGHMVRLVLCVRKFFCKTTSCLRRIFTERLPKVVAPYSRTTERLTMLLRAIAFAVGGEAGARLAKRIGMRASPATLISLIRRTPLQEPLPARILGVDDWAHRKGKSYGTALVDLERHRLIELLPDRTSETLSRWLRANPGIEIISRDRSETYATGARQGAPDAIQVADRWHLLHNWREAVERVFDRHRGRIKQLILPTQEPTDKPAAAALPAKSVNRRRKYLEEQQARSQAKRLARYKVIRERHAKGEYLTTIARDLQIDYKTARKYALSDECPTRKSHPRRRRILEPYEPYLRARWAEGCKNGRGLYREIVAHGYPGSRTQVATFVAQLRRQEQRGGKPQTPTTTVGGEALTPHTASMLLMRRPERCGEAEHTTIAQLREVHQDIGVALSFTERFVEIVRERQGIKLSKWLSDAEASGIHEIQQFAYKVRRDEAAVEAGCTLPWSNGQTEGQITKLKAIKRSMYGRAKFDLLCRRALHAA
jgi:transposase